MQFVGYILTIKKFLFEALVKVVRYDQAAHIFDVLAWSSTQSRVYDPPSVFDAIS